MQFQAGLPSIIASYSNNFFAFVTILPNTTEEENFIDYSTGSETEVTSQNIPNPLTSEKRSLPMDNKRILAQLGLRKYAPLQKP